MIDVAPQEVLWLERFFAGENELSWKRIADQQGSIEWLAQVLPWLAFLRTVPLQKPLVLPVFNKVGPVRWYGVADDQRVLAQLSDEVNGFVGPSYSDFDGHLVELATSSPVELALRERFGSLAVCFRAAAGTDGFEVGRRLLLYQSVLARRPPIRNRSQRPFGRIRGDFDRALLTGDPVAARELIEELVASGRVSADQRKCLEVRFLAGLGRYQELASAHALIGSIADLPIPAQTLLDVISALHIVYIAPMEATSDVEVIKKAFQRRIATPYGPLFRQWHGIRDPRVLRAFLLYESTSETPNNARAEALLSAYPPNGDGWQLARRIFDSLRTNLTGDTAALIEQARQAIDDEDYETAVALCFKILPENWAYKGLLRCAVSLNSSELTSRVLALISEASDDVAKGLTSKDRARLQQLSVPREIAPLARHADWVQWAEWVLSQANAAVQLADLDTAFPTWSVDEFAADSAKCKILASYLGSATNDAEAVFREAVPKLVEFFVVQPEKPVRAFAPIYVVLLHMIAWGDAASGNELQLCSSVAEALLSIGTDKQSYDNCIDALGEILRTNDSPSTLDWALNVAELLAVHPSPRPDLGLQFFTQVVALCQKWAHRLSKAQRAILEVLAKDFNCHAMLGSLPPPEVEIEKSGVYAGYSGLIAIYSLATGAAKRAREVLHQLLPAARIELNEDLVATDRLKGLAKSADIFVFAWKKSTHQAYYCAKEARGGRELALAQGGGTASVVRVVIDSI